MKTDRAYLLHLIESIERIENYTVQGKAAFLKEPIVQDAVLRNLQTLAESTQRISPAVKEANPEVGWRRIAAFRNVLVHDYLGVDLEEVWKIVERNLSELKRQIERIVAE